MSQAQVTASFCEIAISELADGVAIADLIPVDSRVEAEHVSKQPGDQIDKEEPALLLAFSSLVVILGIKYDILS